MTLQDILDFQVKLARAKEYMKKAFKGDWRIYIVSMKSDDGVYGVYDFFGLSKAGFMLKAMTNVLKDVGFEERLIDELGRLERENLREEARLLEERHIQITQEMLGRD